MTRGCVHNVKEVDMMQRQQRRRRRRRRCDVRGHDVTRRRRQESSWIGGD